MSVDLCEMRERLREVAELFPCQADLLRIQMDSIYFAHTHGAGMPHQGWTRLSGILDWLCEHWDEPDEGVWETRGGRQDFVYGWINSWSAFDRAIRIATDSGRPGNVARWLTERDHIYRQVMDRGWHDKRGAFVQHYATDVLDASLLRMVQVGFVTPEDPRWLSTLNAMDGELVSDSLVYRYNPEASPGRAARFGGHVLTVHLLVCGRAGTLRSPG